jgi:crotonobetainyl-CoA:carnitine CoA-transferase CaiB-like acyl-CoA transferase
MVDKGNAALEGIRIIDFSHVFQGPVGTQILADYGADVIKVERPGEGDWSRSWGPFIGGFSLPYAGLNRNKRSVTINLKAEAGRRIVFQLVENADVFVHNFRPGVMEKLGLGYEDLKKVNPRLIYARSSGWGDEGPYIQRGRPGHDLLARAAAGWFQTLVPDKPPIPGGMSADYPAGLMLAVGILLALVARERTGRGQLVTTDLFSVAFHAHAWESAEMLNRERVPDGAGIGATEQAIDKSFRTRDGLIELSPVFSDNALRDISTAMGLGDLSQDPRFRTVESQLARREELNAILAGRFLEKTTEEWLSTLEPQGVLCGEIKTFEEAARDPQIRANNMVVEMEHPRLGGLRLLGTPLRLYDTPPSLRIPPADLGAHNRQVLGELGYSQEEITELEEHGVLG